VVLDTCALYPAYLRDTLLRLANAGAFRPLWSTDILDELERNLAERTDPERAHRVTELMRRHFPDASITGYEPLITAMTNNAKDRHVLAVVLSPRCHGASERTVTTRARARCCQSVVTGMRNAPAVSGGVRAILPSAGC
jgi:hypothetical protein